MIRCAEPIPSIFAPIATSRLQRSTISGSRAALNSCVRPLREHRGHHRILGRADRHDREAEVAARQAGPWARSPSHSRRRARSRRPSPRAPSGAGRSAGRRSRSRRAATPSLRPSAPASARAPAPRRASCAPCRRARRSRRSRRPEASSAARTRPSSPRRREVETPSWLSRWPKVSTSASRGRLVSVSFSSVRSAQGMQRQRRILRAADRDFAVELGPALDPDAVHRGGV